MAVLSLSALFLMPLCAQVNKRLSREAIDSIKNMKSLESNKAVLYFDKYTHDMGTVYESDSVQTAVFAFTNVSKEVVVITDIVTNCGCASSLCSKSIVAPGEKGTVTVKFNPRSRSGSVDTNAFVYTTLSSTLPTAKLTLLGNVVDMNEWSHLPCSMGSLRLKSKNVIFEQVKDGMQPQMRIMCANVGVSPLRIFSRILPEYASLTTEPEELAPGEEGDIVIRIDGNKLPADGANSFDIMVEGVEGRLSDRIIKVKIKKNR